MTDPGAGAQANLITWFESRQIAELAGPMEEQTGLAASFVAA
jgi:hypothetical protein